MRVRTEQRRTFEAYRPVAERGSFRADGHDADMFHRTPLVMLHAAATVGRFDVPTATSVRGCDVSAAARGFEGANLFRMLPLEGLHLFRVLALKFLLLRKMLPLLGHLSRRLLAHERLRLLLMPPDEFRRLLSVIRLDSLPITAGAFFFGRGLGALLLIFLQVLALERRRFGIMFLLKLPQLRGLLARGVLL